ncbi:nucleotidyltransferase domain-containing protein [Peribacillus simplex]|uniref:Nucleotidyltransferase domain-containing protein n=2 Tax=Peribacillus simplex TaxID=1478 RepID=A0A8B5XVP8_9BACI|nr:nucleotidyltransferase domain-containing protein [Peribacillus simplex]
MVLCAGFVSKHIERDAFLPKQRDILLENAFKDLSADPDVLAIYLAGSLAKGNDDNYSDIDLHTIVISERQADFLKRKRNRANNWGNVTFYEDYNPSSPYVVTHYNTFVKVDSWYHAPEEIVPSIWLKEVEVIYDPFNIMSHVIKESEKLVYKPSPNEVEHWRGKVLAFVHETYRAVMRREMLYALSNLDRIRWLIVSGWYMEMEEHVDVPYGVWTKIEGNRSKLDGTQLSLLESWDCGRNSNEIIKTLRRMIPEFLRLNKYLCTQVGVETNEDHIKRIMDMAI